jgi:drug/metabolite transporter (DMT)-like permease
MPTSVMVLVVASAVAHAAWNALLKRCREPENAIVAMMLIAAASSSIFAFATHVPAPPARSAAWIIASGVLEAGYFVTLARALARAPLGSVYTVVRGGALVLVWPISIVVLGEIVTLGRGLGTLLVVLGLVATGAGQRSPALVRDEKRGPKERSGLAVAALCAMFVGGYHLAYKLALSSGGSPEAVIAVSLSTASAINIVAIGQRRARVFAALRDQPIRIIVGGLLASGGFLVFLWAMASAGAGVVLTLRNTSILFAQGFAVALGERPRRLGLLGAALVTAGAVLLAR